MEQTTMTTTTARTIMTMLMNVTGDKQSVQENDEIDTPHKETSVVSVKKPSAGLSTSILMPDDILVMNVTVKTNVAVGTVNPMGKPISPDIQAILNITNRGKGQDYEYDYSDPTSLPPSLPNVR